MSMTEYKNSSMTGVGSDHSANWALTTTPIRSMCQYLYLDKPKTSLTKELHVSV